MNRITSILAIALLMASCGSTKKSVTPNKIPNTIRTDFTNYIQAITNKEFSKSLDYVLPEFFEIFPKAEMIKVMEQTFSNPEMEIEFKNPTILSVGEAMKVDERYYSKMRYSNMMNMKMNVEGEETKEDKEMRIQLLQMSLNQSMGEGNVKYNAETDFFEIYSEKDVFAISDNSKSDWKFLVNEENQQFILEKLLPKEVMMMK